MDEFGKQTFLVFCNGAVVTALFVVLLLNHKSVRQSRANIFLSVLLVALAFSIMHILYAGKVIRHISQTMYAPGDPTFLLIAPLTWFYAVELTGQRVKLNGSMWWHLGPFFLIVFFSLLLGSGHFPMLNTIFGNHTQAIYIFFKILVVIQFSWYQYLVQKKWQAHQRLLQQEVSNTENVNISWVKFTVNIFLVISLFFFFSLVFYIHWQGQAWLAKATAVVFSVTVLALSFRGILQRDVFNTVAPEKLPEPTTGDIPTNPPPPKPDQALIDKLLLHMTNQKPYLDPELSLSTLANNLHMSRTQLSQLINDGVGDNFYDFINKYRVEEVKKLMADPAMAAYSLLGIAFEAGFKSKSTFNLIFKRFTGLTPTEYRKNLTA